MEKISRVVVIPIYRLLTERERISLRQCFRVFGTEDICFVTYSELSLSDCYALAKEYGLKVARKNFKKYYFRSVQGYNHLMLTPPLYQAFREYNYMLIYQLDAFAFDNQLDYWCSKDFEYIGAPVCPNYWYKPTCFYMNGGFSLRKISACCNAFRGYGWYRLILQGARAFPIPYKSLQLVKEIYSLLAAFCLKHQIPIVFNKLMHEDLLWTTALGQKTDYQDAARFAWEAQPEMLFQQIGHLPFGCHAWERYEYESFWSQHGIK